MAGIKTQFSTPDKRLSHFRLLVQGLIRPHHESPLEVVRSYGAMQGQDLGVISSVALRTKSGDVQAVIDAMNRHELVRGYPMRGTVFMAAAEDMRWITELCSNSISLQGRRHSEKNYGLTAEMYDRLIAEVQHLGYDGITRAEYKELVAKTLPELTDSATGLAPQGITYRSLFQLLIEHVLVYSGWDGSDQKIFLAKEILGGGIGDTFGGDLIAATAVLLTRYVQSHGFVSIEDFAWWSKLPKALIKEAIHKLPDRIRAINIISCDLDRPTWGLHQPASAVLRDSAKNFGEANTLADVDALDAQWEDWQQGTQVVTRAVMKPMLLPAFDEFILGYQDRCFAMTPAVHEALVPGNRGIFKKPVVIDGTVRGAWNRKGTVGKRKLEIDVFSSVAKTAYPKLEKAFQEFPFLTD